MTHADVHCTCGNRFAVADDGNGAPHPCPKCHVQNVLPRTRSRVVDVPQAALATTDVRHTAVLSPVAAAHQSAVLGLPAGSMLGPYRLVRRVGKGGMGSVYEAFDERSSQRVALKVLSPELAAQPDFVARFHRESRALSGLSDPRIAKVYFSGAAEGMPFFAMEYVEGRNLDQVLEQDGPPPFLRAIAWMKEIAAGLEAAASRGIIHRDVKPTNVLIDKAGAVRIVDFGLAKALDSDTRVTVTGAVVGTPFYLSPEQGLGKPVDQRSDIYSLGATFYHLLTKRPPFDADNSVSIILKHVHDAATPIRDLAPDVSEPLARVVMRCLAKDPRHRYQDYDELVRDLDAAARGEPVAAPSESATIRRSPTYVVMDDLVEGSLVLRRATRLRRTLAFLVDGAVVLLVAKLVSKLHLSAFEGAAIAAPFALFYFAWGDGSGGQSIGKRMFDLRVARPDGGRLGPVRALLRALLLAPLALAILAAMRRLAPSLEALVAAIGPSYGSSIGPMITIGNLWILAAAGVDAAASLVATKGQTLHDLLSASAVFRVETVKRRKKKAIVRDKPLPPHVPAIAAVLPGMGQFLNGEMGKGILFFVGIAAGFNMQVFPGLAVWGLSAVEAHRTARARYSRWEREQSGAGTL